MFFKTPPKPMQKKPAAPMPQAQPRTAPAAMPRVAPINTLKTPAAPKNQSPMTAEPPQTVQPVSFEAPEKTAPAPQPVPPVSAPVKEPVQEAKPVNPYARPANYKEEEPPKPEVKEEENKAEEKGMEPHVETLENGDKVFVADSLVDVDFSDIWYTPEKVAYIRDKSTKFALIPFETKDMNEFYKMLEQGYSGSSSYAGQFKGENYRIERVITTTGVQYNCRKMPVKTPNLYKLGIPDPITKYLATLATEAGLILFAGPTGMGKTTTASALMREFLETHGGFLYTIEDPPEMPLDGLYHAKNGALGLCKQSPVENERWEDGLKSALRSKPRYILVGEIRTPEVASQVLRAATSGHLVLSTIHAMSVEDALNSMLKYASGAGLDEKLVADLLARGILAVIHQKLEGTTKLHPVIQTVFANPNPLMPDQMRSAIREGRISLGTLMESQSTKLFKGLSMFKSM